MSKTLRTKTGNELTHAQILVVDPARPDATRISRAAVLLREGGLVAFPTETVYGLGANALDADALARVFAAKGRPEDNPLIVHVASLAALAGVVAEITPLARELAAQYWPGPLTLVLAAHADLPRVVTAGLDTVAVRVPDHAVALALLAEAGVPVAAPSANRSGRPSPTTAAHVIADLGDVLDVIVDGGPCRVGVESTVVDARGDVPVVLREGAISREMLGLSADSVTDLAEPDRSPGTRHAHYQPSIPVLLAPIGEAAALADAQAAGGQRVGAISAPATSEAHVQVGVFADSAELAANLYAWLRAAETADIDVLIVESVPEEGLGRAVMDRLRRAAGQH